MALLARPCHGARFPPHGRDAGTRRRVGCTETPGEKALGWGQAAPGNASGSPKRGRGVPAGFGAGRAGGISVFPGRGAPEGALLCVRSPGTRLCLPLPRCPGREAARRAEGAGARLEGTGDAQP